MKKCVINGKFFTQRMVGVQRYALEIVKELDKMISPGEIEIAIPRGAKDIPAFDNIQVVSAGKLSGILWEQISFPLYVLKSGRMPVNLCNASPFLFPGIVCIHDMKTKTRPGDFGKRYLLWFKAMIFNVAKRAEGILTVSEFSKSEIMKYYHVPSVKITVIPSAWQHYAKIPFEESALAKFGLKSGEYYFAVGSLEPNKNFKWIAEVAKKNPHEIFAIAGSINKRVFTDGLDFDCPDNMKFLGFVSDSEAKMMMRECKAFLYPSFYEGFGLPPLEALSVGAKIIISHTSCLPEVYEDVAYYIDPTSVDIDLNDLLHNKRGNPEKILAKYSWEKSAQKLLNTIENIK